jgi:hypothetical protein
VSYSLYLCLFLYSFLILYFSWSFWHLYCVQPIFQRFYYLILPISLYSLLLIIYLLYSLLLFIYLLYSLLLFIYLFVSIWLYYANKYEILYSVSLTCGLPIPVSARSKAWVSCRSLAGIVGSNPTGRMDVSLVSVVCFQVKVSASGWSLVQRSRTACGVSECYREASIMRRPWPTRGCCAMEKKMWTDLTPCFLVGTWHFVKSGQFWFYCRRTRSVRRGLVATSIWKDSKKTFEINHSFVGGCSLKLCGLLPFVRSTAILTLQSSRMACITRRLCAVLQSENDTAEHISLLVGVAENRQDKLSVCCGIAVPACPAQSENDFSTPLCSNWFVVVRLCLVHDDT